MKRKSARITDNIIDEHSLNKKEEIANNYKLFKKLNALQKPSTEASAASTVVPFMLQLT